MIFHSRFINLLIVFILFLAAANPASALRLKIATLSPPAAIKYIKEGADLIAQKTDNRVTFKFYYNSRMGTDKVVLKKIKAGQLHGSFIVGGSLSQYFPANQLYAQPMKFKTTEEVEYVRGYMDHFISDGLANNPKNGFVTFGLVGGGFAYIMSKNRIETVKELQKQKVWIPDNDLISKASIRAFGLSPIPLPISEVRTSLQTGLIDTVANSPVGAIVLQWHTQVKYVVNVPLIYLYAVLAIDKDKFSKISEPDQKIVRDILMEASKKVEAKNRQDEIDNINTLKKRGVTFITPNPEALKEWEKVGRTASEKMVETGVLPADVAEELDMHLQTFHATKKAANAE